MPDAREERDLLVSALRLMAVAHDAVAVVISAEVWSDPDHQDGRRPSESPNRRESLNVSVMYRHEGGIFLDRRYAKFFAMPPAKYATWEHHGSRRPRCVAMN